MLYLQSEVLYNRHAATVQFKFTYAPHPGATKSAPHYYHCSNHVRSTPAEQKTPYSSSPTLFHSLVLQSVIPSASSGRCSEFQILDRSASPPLMRIGPLVYSCSRCHPYALRPCMDSRFTAEHEVIELRCVHCT